MIKAMAFVAYSVRDVPGAVKFYRDVMGLTIGSAIGEHWVEFDVAGMTFGIGNGEPLGIMPGSSFSVTFEVDDLDAERKRLLDLNVPVTDIFDAPNCRSAFVTDPEGNKFGIHQQR
jgi:predicted enzyme related to lactoylglutathione lyase